jgi:hypothetical protein
LGKDIRRIQTLKTKAFEEGSMKRLVMLLLVSLVVCGCQSSQKSKEELAAICV